MKTTYRYMYMHVKSSQSKPMLHNRETNDKFEQSFQLSVVTTGLKKSNLVTIQTSLFFFSYKQIIMCEHKPGLHLIVGF